MPPSLWNFIMAAYQNQHRTSMGESVLLSFPTFRSRLYSLASGPLTSFLKASNNGWSSSHTMIL